jgi:hypothetical protein
LREINSNPEKDHAPQSRNGKNNGDVDILPGYTTMAEEDL